MFLYARTSKVIKHIVTQKQASAIQRTSNSLINLVNFKQFINNH